MESSSFKNLYVFKNELYRYKDIKDLHYKLLNILFLWQISWMYGTKGVNSASLYDSGSFSRL